MKCDRCQAMIEAGEEKELHSQILCEDCYMDALSPPQGCDPWAVYLATRTSSEKNKNDIEVTDIQARILQIIKDNRKIEPDILYEKLRGEITLPDLKRELATLRHMEKIRGQNIEGKVILRLW